MSVLPHCTEKANDFTHPSLCKVAEKRMCSLGISVVKADAQITKWKTHKKHYNVHIKNAITNRKKTVT